jgi:hypothetical protein
MSRQEAPRSRRRTRLGRDHRPRALAACAVVSSFWAGLADSRADAEIREILAILATSTHAIASRSAPKLFRVARILSRSSSRVLQGSKSFAHVTELA